MSFATERETVEGAKTLIDLHLALKDLITPGFENDSVELTLTKKQIAFLQVMIEREMGLDLQ